MALESDNSIHTGHTFCETEVNNSLKSRGDSPKRITLLGFRWLGLLLYTGPIIGARKRAGMYSQQEIDVL